MFKRKFSCMTVKKLSAERNTDLTIWFDDLRKDGSQVHGLCVLVKNAGICCAGRKG
ncbi:MAG: hypothetical protein IJR63_06660 [Synergistaceae bacterium]|nr:hypothetical protein [Synergistaceae bacterium]